MSMVTSFNLLMSQTAPPVLKAPFGAALRSAGKPAAALPLQRKSPRLSVRANNSPESSADTGHPFGIAPFALVHPKFPPTSGNRWRITEDDDYVKLWFHVGEIDREKLKVRIEHDTVLLVSYGGAGDETSTPANSLDVRLLLPNKPYDTAKVEAELTFGTLLVTVAKRKPLQGRDKVGIPITPAPSNEKTTTATGQTGSET
uniref:SHSP domain-containing protein n=1 Tax=Oryza meridionalis TaxID=40149 RepID=A0A0E0ER12_9ORYZ